MVGAESFVCRARAGGKMDCLKSGSPGAQWCARGFGEKIYCLIKFHGNDFRCVSRRLPLPHGGWGAALSLDAAHTAEGEPEGDEGVAVYTVLELVAGGEAQHAEGGDAYAGHESE